MDPMRNLDTGLITEVTAADYEKAYSALRLLHDVRPKIDRCEQAGIGQSENRAVCDVLQRRLNDYMKVYFPNGKPNN
jgi:hypothetical protein